MQLLLHWRRESPEKRTKRELPEKNAFFVLHLFLNVWQATSGEEEEAISEGHPQSEKWTWPSASTFLKRKLSSAGWATSRITAGLFTAFWVLEKRDCVGRSPIVSATSAHRWQYQSGLLGTTPGHFPVQLSLFYFIISIQLSCHLISLLDGLQAAIQKQASSSPSHGWCCLWAVVLLLGAPGSCVPVIPAPAPFALLCLPCGDAQMLSDYYAFAALPRGENSGCLGYLSATLRSGGTERTNFI